MALFGGSTDGLTADTCPVTDERAPTSAPNCWAPATPSRATPRACPRPARPPAPRASTPASTRRGSTSATCRPRTRCPSPRSELLELRQPADGLVRHPEPGRRHARRHHRGQATPGCRTNISAYATWAKAHNSLLIVTWDEDDYTENNQIPTVFYGAHVRPGTQIGGDAHDRRAEREGDEIAARRHAVAPEAHRPDRLRTLRSYTPKLTSRITASASSSTNHSTGNTADCASA